MKIFKNRLKPESQQATEGPYRDETSFEWRGKDPDKENVTDSRRGTPDELASSDTMTIRTLTLDEESAYIVDESVGIDPYNTGSFDAS
jgi:hypothetical protein